MTRSIAKNTLWITLAFIGQKALALFYFLVLARVLDAADLGKYTAALSFALIFAIFVDLGFTNVLVRESAKAAEKTQEYFSTVLSLRFFFGVFAYAALVVAVHLLGYDLVKRQLIYLAGGVMLLDSLHLALYGVLRAVGDLRFEAWGILLSQSLTFAVGLVCVWLQLPLYTLMLAFLVPSFVNVCYATWAVRKRAGILFRIRYDREIFVYLGKIAIPFAIAGVFARVYSYIDSAILLPMYAGDEAVGWYSLPYKITFAFQFIPMAFVAALYPRFSEYYASNKQQLARLFEQGIKYLLVIVFPISVGVAVLAQDIILIINDQFTPAIVPLQILIMSLIFSFISFPIGAFLNACDRQVTQTAIVGIVMVINIVANVLLIPEFGITGAATAAFIGNVCLMVFGYFFVPKITTVSHGFLFRTALSVAFAAGLMGIAVYFVNAVVPVAVSVVVGVVVYSVVILATRVMTVGQCKELVLFLKR